MKKMVQILCFAALVLFSCKPQVEETQTELLWYGIGGETQDIPQVFSRISEDLAKMGAGYSIAYQNFGWGDYGQKIQLILAAGERADIVFMASWAGNYFSTAASGYFTELDELLEGQPKLKALLQPAFWDAVRVSGKIYGVPNYKDMVYQEYAAFNSDLLAKHNIKLPQANITWRELTPIFAQIRRLEPDYIAYDGGGLGIIRGDFPLGPAMPIALSFAEPEKGFQVLTESREFQDNARLMRQWVEAGYRDPDAYLKKDTDNSGKKNWFVRNYQGFPGAEVSLSKGWGVPMEVRWLSGPPILDNGTPLGAILSIPASSPNAKTAMDFLMRLNTDPAIRNLVGHGIEGVHYNLDANGQVVRTEKGQNNYDMPNFSVGSFLVLNTLAGEPKDAREQLRKFNEDAEPSPALGFAIDKEKYSQVIAQVSAISAPYRDAVMYGLKPADETLAEWRIKLREVGWFEAVAEINQSYMQWKKSRN